jgi:hypothetical protein
MGERSMGFGRGLILGKIRKISIRLPAHAFSNRLSYPFGKQFTSSAVVFRTRYPSPEKNEKPLKNKKRGVHRPHGDMLPGNSFPQICVVSVNRIVENAESHKST